MFLSGAETSSTSAENIHGLIDEDKNATWRTESSSFSLKIWLKWWKLGLRDGFGPSNMWHLCIKQKSFLYIGLFWEKTSLIFLEFILIFLEYGFQKDVSNRKIWDPKIRSQRWIQLSQYATPVGKLREVIVLWPVRNKNLL